MTFEPASDAAIDAAARVILSGGLAAFPTETVYGLGAHAADARAVARVYAVKGRPGDNPLILHAASPQAALAYAERLPGYASRLLETFWPGPLTVIVHKKKSLAPFLGGHPSHTAQTLALRVPSHPVAHALLERAGVPIAAPSANRSGRPSPTRAQHVAEDLGQAVDFILDGGEVPGGLESTVVDITGEAPVILRPGAVTEEMLAEAVGKVIGHTLFNPQEPPRSPGMKYRHYAPQAEMTVWMGDPEQTARRIINLIEQTNARAGILATRQTEDIYRRHFSGRIWMNPGEDCDVFKNRIVLLTAGNRDKPQTIAQSLYACLRRFDTLQVDVIYSEGVAETGLGRAIMNRLSKAAGGRVEWV